ncbi:MAG: hypothetical protein DMF89_19095 [Acidobacteria bacterium]|nr:MAG: hypothetical protein DMF89_19095 [Acidobacteriota bacterium]
MSPAQLADLAAAIADGRPIDWGDVSILECDIPPTIAARVRLVERIAQLHASLPPAASFAQSLHQSLLHANTGDAGTADTPVAWGPLNIVEKIGRGTFGDVYRARDPRLDRPVALKLLRRKDRRESAVIQEGRLLARVRHPNVVTVYGAERIDGRVGLWMEFVEGRTLEEELTQRGPFAPEEVRSVGLDLARALGAVHRAGLLHRDLKAQNVMRGADGRVLLTDFGAGREVSESAFQSGHELAGTPLYMAPEVLEGHPASVSSDIYGLGVLLYHLATGAFPVSGRSLRDLRDAHARDARVPLRSKQSKLPRSVAAAIDRAIQSDPTSRHASAGEFEAALVPSARARRPLGYAAATLALTLVVGVALTGLSGWGWRTRPPLEAVPRLPLVAVMPFRSLSADSAHSYLAESITEGIRGQLSGVAALRLLSRAATEKYGEVDSTTMANELGATSIVAGSVRLDRDRMRIVVELVDAGSQQTRWSEQYERQLADVFAVQSDIAISVARMLSARLSPDERARVEKPPTRNPEAYQLYLRVNESFMADREKNLASMELLKKALAVDPAFAAAEARLAYRTLFLSSYDSPKYVDEGILLAQDSIRLDPALAYGHFALAAGYYFKGMSAQARLSLLRALELEPSHLGSMQNLSLLETSVGRLDEALSWARRGFQLSARIANDYYHVSIPLMSLRDDDLTFRWLTDAERLFPSDPVVQVMLARLDALRNETPRALMRVRRSADKWPGMPFLKGALVELALIADAKDAPALASAWFNAAPEAQGGTLLETPRVWHAFLLNKAGDSTSAAQLLQKAESVARELLSAGSDSPYLPAELAAVTTIRGDRNSALEWLERAYFAGHRDYGVLERDPIFESLRPDSRFRDLTQRMKNDVAAMRQRAADRGLLDLASLKSSTAATRK